jgi:hypothetical protein
MYTKAEVSETRGTKKKFTLAFCAAEPEVKRSDPQENKPSGTKENKHKRRMNLMLNWERLLFINESLHSARILGKE